MDFQARLRVKGLVGLLRLLLPIHVGQEVSVALGPLLAWRVKLAGCFVCGELALLSCLQQPALERGRLQDWELFAWLSRTKPCEGKPRTWRRALGHPLV